MTEVNEIVNALSGRDFRYTNEAALHAGMALVFAEHGFEYHHEVTIEGGRIDFVIDRVGVEVKIKGAPAALARQIEGYGPEPRLDEFLVVTTRPAHRSVNGVTANGKRVRVLTLGGLSL